LRAQPKNVGTAVRLERRKIDGDEWLIFSIIDDAKGPLLMIRHYDVEAYVDSVYDLRNRILRYLAPVIILLLILMTYYMTSVVMRPIRQLENSLAGLTSSNLDKPIDVLPPYREFDRFVTVFEQLRERLNQSFVQTRRFAADASHELRTPLTILRGNSERLIAELPTGSDQQIRMRLIGDEIERLIEITEKLLLLSRADANSIRYDMETVSLSTMITELALDAMAFQPSLKIHSDVEPHVLCRCDRSLMHQLVHNLYTNAAKYNAANGWIRFSLTCQQDRYTLIVENPCDNIPADLVERAFQRFYRGDAARGREIDGIGLGLSLSREIARLHQATLSLRVTDQNTVVATLEAPLSPTKL
jgi:signal transduction histidine kinase